MISIKVNKLKSFCFNSFLIFAKMILKKAVLYFLYINCLFVFRRLFVSLRLLIKNSFHTPNKIFKIENNSNYLAYSHNNLVIINI